MVKNLKQKNKKFDTKGVALLFTVLLTSAILLVALGISNVSYKELSFSIEARDSGKAFFAADTGIECALYLEKEGYFSSTPPSTSGVCNNASIDVSVGPPTFVVAFPVTSDSCAEMYIDTGYNSGADTEIRSYGYNTVYNSTLNKCDTLVSSRTVIRALRVVFPNPTP